MKMIWGNDTELRMINWFGIKQVDNVITRDMKNMIIDSLRCYLTAKKKGKKDHIEDNKFRKNQKI
jgi:hypothetical protein